MPNPEHKKMTAMHFYGWEKGLKTGQYYLRSRPARDAIKFTVNMEALLQAADQKDPNLILNALDKVNEPKTEEAGSKKTSAINLGRKTTEPRAGFSEDVYASDTKRQKITEEVDEEYDPFTCENCGS